LMLLHKLQPNWCATRLSQSRLKPSHTVDTIETIRLFLINGKFTFFLNK